MALMAEATVLHEYSQLGISDINKLGSAALHDCFIAELEKRDMWDDPEVRWSYDFSMDLHKDEMRADGLYVDHLVRVGLWVVRKFGIDDPEAAKVALLHDAVENHPESIIQVLGTTGTTQGTVYERALDALRNSGKIAQARTSAAIGALTCPSFKGMEPAIKRRAYAWHIIDVTLKDPLAAVGKLADRFDNANGNKHNTDLKLQRWLDGKYYPLHDAFVDAVRSKASLIPDNRKEEMVSKLEKGHEEAKERLLRELPGIPAMTEDEVDALTLENVLGQKDAA